MEKTIVSPESKFDDTRGSHGIIVGKYDQKGGQNEKVGEIGAARRNEDEGGLAAAAGRYRLDWVDCHAMPAEEQQCSNSDAALQA